MLEDLDLLVRTLHNKGAKHRKRGFKLNEVTKECAAAHLGEEVSEYIAVTIAPEGRKLVDKEKGTYQHLLEESADTLLTWLHLNWINGLPLKEILVKAESKLDDIFILE